MHRQTQRVHEHRGSRTTMVVNSRALLATAAVIVLLGAVISNVLDGGSTFEFIVLALGLILAAFIWLLFDSKANSASSGSTVISVNHSIGRGAAGTQHATSTTEEELPDPLDSGIDVPLL